MGAEWVRWGFGSFGFGAWQLRNPLEYVFSRSIKFSPQVYVPDNVYA